MHSLKWKSNNNLKGQKIYGKKVKDDTVKYEETTTELKPKGQRAASLFLRYFGLNKMLFFGTLFILYFFEFSVRKNFMASFYGWGSTTSRLEPLRRGSLLFTTKFQEIPGTHFIDHWRMKSWVDFGGFEHGPPGLGIHLTHFVRGREDSQVHRLLT